MKLYTEEQVKQMIEKSQDTGLTAEYLILTRSPIELPSDEEIESGMNQRLFLSDKNAHFNSGAKAGFKLGAKWIKEQIFNQNK